MVDPISTILVTAFAVGASKAADTVGEKVIGDLYDGLKSIVKAGYGKAAQLLAAIAGLEENPASEGRKAVLAEELKTAGALEDRALLSAAEKLVAAAKASGPAVGIDWKRVEAAEVELGKVRAHDRAIGVRITDSTIFGKFKTGDIDAGGPGNA
jgi:hypothetical protein